MRAAIGTPSSTAARSSPRITARRIPRRRCVGATVTELMADAGTAPPPGSDSSAIHDANVATGVCATGAAGSYTPILRRYAV